MGSPGQFGGRVYANSCDNLCAGLKEDNYSFQLFPRTPRVQPCSDWERREEGEMRRHSSNDIPPVSECRRSSAPATLPVQVPRTFSSRLASSFSYTKGVINTDPTPTPITPQTPRRTFFSHYPSSSLLSGLGSVRPPSAILEASCEGSDAFPTSECIHAGCFSVSADLLAAANMTPIVEGAGMISNTASSATASSPKERSHGRNPDPEGPGEPGRFFSTDPGPSHPRDTENAFKSPYGVGVEATKTSSSIVKSLTMEEDVILDRKDSQLSQSVVVPSLLILIADDSPVTRKMTKRVLQFQGYDVVEAGDGKACLEIVACGARTGAPVDIILVGNIACNVWRIISSVFLCVTAYHAIL
jgi:CheY-like chemotaxis protein